MLYQLSYATMMRLPGNRTRKVCARMLVHASHTLPHLDSNQDQPVNSRTLLPLSYGGMSGAPVPETIPGSRPEVTPAALQGT